MGKAYRSRQCKDYQSLQGMAPESSSPQHGEFSNLLSGVRVDCERSLGGKDFLEEFDAEQSAALRGQPKNGKQNMFYTSPSGSELSSISASLDELKQDAKINTVSGRSLNFVRGGRTGYNAPSDSSTTASARSPKSWPQPPRSSQTTPASPIISTGDNHALRLFISH